MTLMPTLTMRIWDVTSSRSTQVEAPDDVPIRRLLVLLVERMNLPLNSPDGQIMSYKLHHKRSGQQLLDAQTLVEAGVANGDDLRVQPEITAGRRSLTFGSSAKTPRAPSSPRETKNEILFLASWRSWRLGAEVFQE